MQPDWKSGCPGWLPQHAEHDWRLHQIPRGRRSPKLWLPLPPLISAGVRILEGGKMPTELRDCAEDSKILERASDLEIPPPAPGVHIAYGANEFQFGELYLPEGRGPHRVAIVIHGGYWRARYDLRQIGHFCVGLTKAGIAAWCLEYRRLAMKGRIS